MTNERREEVVLVALAVSVAIHVALMFLVKTQVMTQTTSVTRRTDRAVPMRVTERAPAPDPVKIEELLDLKAIKDAPSVVQEKGVPLVEAPNAAVAPKVEVPPDAAPVVPTPQEIVTTSFDAKTVGRETSPGPVLPLTRIETPKMTSAESVAPSFSTKMPDFAAHAAPQVSAPTAAPGSVLLPSKISAAASEDEDAARVVFTPAKEVYERVDERIVAEEKSAVRELVNAESPEDLRKFVNVAMKTARAGGWCYYKVMMTPRSDLPTVPKDVVLVIDGSGSIGKDRFGNCRTAARKILRTCTNTGDRFNLVVFRNAFSYAFRNWQECDADGFAAGDRWLAKQAAHGRTDVFSTIRSILTLPRDPKRPLIALVVTDGDANSGVSDTAEILSRFTALNDGLVSVYMYGVKSSANRELIDVLTHGNRGESFIFEGWRWNAGEGMEGLSERFRDPVLSDLRVIYAAGTQAEAYPLLLRNLYAGDTLSFVGRVPAATRELAFSLRGLNAATAFEGFFKLPLSAAPADPSIVAEWESERAISAKLAPSK